MAKIRHHKNHWPEEGGLFKKKGFQERLLGKYVCVCVSCVRRGVFAKDLWRETCCKSCQASLLWRLEDFCCCCCLRSYYEKESSRPRFRSGPESRNLLSRDLPRFRTCCSGDFQLGSLRFLLKDKTCVFVWLFIKNCKTPW
jgi:hypothetical protein